MVSWGRVVWGRKYEHDRREGHSFELDVEFITGLELCGCFLWRLGCDGADEVMAPFGDSWEVEELFLFDGQRDRFLCCLEPTHGLAQVCRRASDFCCGGD